MHEALEEFARQICQGNEAEHHLALALLQADAVLSRIHQVGEENAYGKEVGSILTAISL